MNNNEPAMLAIYNMTTILLKDSTGIPFFAVFTLPVLNSK